jgi:hypothetical protein
MDEEPLGAFATYDDAAAYCAQLFDDLGPGVHQRMVIALMVHFCRLAPEPVLALALLNEASRVALLRHRLAIEPPAGNA